LRIIRNKGLPVLLNVLYLRDDPKLPETKAFFPRTALTANLYRPQRLSVFADPMAVGLDHTVKSFIVEAEH